MGSASRQSQEEHRRGNRLCVVLIQKRAERVKGLPRRGVEIRVRKQTERRKGDSLLRPTKGSSAPIQKEGTGPKSCQRRRTRPQSKRSGRFLSLADEEEHGPNPKGVAGLHKVMKRGGRCKSSTLGQKWDFANGATGSDELASMKELAVEVKMVHLVVAKEV